MNLTIPRVARRLRSRATLFTKKKRTNGDEHLKVGKILNAMFPEGLQIKGEHKFSEIAILVRMRGGKDGEIQKGKGSSRENPRYTREHYARFLEAEGLSSQEIPGGPLTCYGYVSA